ncbi:hypothetical protein OKW45_000914 [Paraburkholderia sp. WSM4175]
MPDPRCTGLPDNSSWRFDQIACSDPNRAFTLEMAGPPSALLEATVKALDEAFGLGVVRFGREHAEAQPDDSRAVVQFAVGVGLFDWFFNARTGYRAHFRGCYKRGLEFNKQIIEALRRCLDAKLPDIVIGRELNKNFEDCGETEIPRSLLMDSLVPHLSKVWFCTKLTRPSQQRDSAVSTLGQILPQQPVGVPAGIALP